VKRWLKWAVVGGALVASAALIITLMVMKPSGVPASSPILVPQAKDSEIALPKPPTPGESTLPELNPAASSTTTTPPPETTTTTPPPPPAPPKTAPRQAGVDFQAENALIRSGSVESDHPGFTGTGFVDTDNVSGSFVQWSVNAARTGQADVIFRFANGSTQNRPMDITVNGILAGSLSFPPTGSFDDYRTVTVRVNLLGGTNKIRATSTTDNGGPNLDKITVA
jgi:exo-1,4-beta-D-glucosaminidase